MNSSWLAIAGRSSRSGAVTVALWAITGLSGANEALAREALTQEVPTQGALAPEVPAQEAMPYREMVSIMQMDDTAKFGKLMFDQLEWRDGNAGEARGAWDGQGWYGGDYDKLWVKTEGTYVASGWNATRGSDAMSSKGSRGGNDESGGGGIRDASVDLLWDRVISRWWSLQTGGRQDFGPGQSRTWVALGVQGLAPQWFETEATVYASDEGRTAVRLKAQYELLLTQRLVLQPYMEANLYGRSDRQRQLGSGLSDLQLSARLRFEVWRELAPYVGVAWVRRFGGTAERVRAGGGDAGELRFAAGLRVWF